MRKIFFWIINAVIFLLLFIFAMENLGNVTLKFFSIQWDAPLIILIAVIFALGCFVGVFAMLPFIWSQRKKNKKAIRQAQESNALVKVN